MHALKQKIKRTALLSEEDKIDILVAMDEYSEGDLKELEKIIDTFDATYRRSVSTYKNNVEKKLSDVVSRAHPDEAERMQAAASQIRQGLDALLPC